MGRPLRKYIQFHEEKYYLVVLDDGRWKWASADRRLMLTIGKSVPDDGKFGWYAPETNDLAEIASRHGWNVLVDDTEEFPDWDDHSS